MLTPINVPCQQASFDEGKNVNEVIESQTADQDAILNNKPKTSLEEAKLFMAKLIKGAEELNHTKKLMDESSVGIATDMDRYFIDDSQTAFCDETDELNLVIVSYMTLIMRSQGLKAIKCKNWAVYYKNRLKNEGVVKKRFNAHLEIAEFCVDHFIEVLPVNFEMIDAFVSVKKADRSKLYYQLCNEYGKEHITAALVLFSIRQITLSILA